MKNIYDHVSIKVSRVITNAYSTSFSIGIRCLHKSLHNPIYSIYGFVRLSDEIVDSFSGYDQKRMLDQLEKDAFDAIEKGISLNPVLNSFQEVVNRFNIDHDLIRQFLNSMKMDLEERVYSNQEYELYILGSAEVVGLMCLKIFCEGDSEQYEQLKIPAKKLGAAFQKINFLRDFKTDYFDLKRMYFPNLEIENFNAEAKKKIEEDIAKDFEEGYIGVKKLPKKARFGTYIAYKYYYELLMKIKNADVKGILNNRVRLSNGKKYSIVIVSIIKKVFKLI
ncbi:MAG: phytoene/squalene synthase family protein [Cyclobacteriaceae bacterium]|nr:phytoene/squalene synthase family protein [Cyclobacteriaceae bacterium]